MGAGIGNGGTADDEEAGSAEPVAELDGRGVVLGVLGVLELLSLDNPSVSQRAVLTSPPVVVSRLSQTVKSCIVLVQKSTDLLIPGMV